MPKHAFAQFDGLFLGIHPKQAQRPGVIKGANFYINAEGPKSAFSNSVFCYERIEAGVNFDAFNIDTKHLLFTDQGIYTFDLETKSFIPQYVFSSPQTTFFPWSKAFVGGKWYFVKLGSDLIEYNPSNEQWSVITASVPANACSCCEAGGRLVVLGAQAVAWSELDNGANLVPNVNLGIATQSLAIVGGGTSFAVKAVSDGFIAYTSRGKLFAQFVDLLLPFRFRSIRDQIVPVSPWGITELDETTHIVLSTTGLYKIVSFASEPFLPLLSEHLREKQFNVVTPNIDGAYRIFYDDERQLFFLSVSQNAAFGEYDFAHCVYVPTEKIGQFNYKHDGLFQLPPAIGSPDDTDLGFIGTDNYIRYITQDRRTEVFFGATNIYHVRNELQFTPTQDGAGIYLMPSFMEMYAHEIPEENVEPGLYEISNGEEYVIFETVADPPALDSYSLGYDDGTLFDDGTGFDIIHPLHDHAIMEAGQLVPPNSFYDPEYTGPGSFVELGPFRVLDENHANRLQEVSRVTIGATEFGDTDIFEDWNITQPETSEDWLRDDRSDEDWGVGIVDNSTFMAKLRGSVDAVNTWNNNLQELESVVKENETEIYTASIQGVYVSTLAEAISMGESFHIKTLELDVMPGRVYE